MTPENWLDQLQDVLSDKKHAQLVRCNSIKSVLKKLKKQQNALKDKIKKEKDGDKRKELKRRLLIVRAQRKKGIALVKEAKLAKKAKG